MTMTKLGRENTKKNDRQCAQLQAAKCTQAKNYFASYAFMRKQKTGVGTRTDKAESNKNNMMSLEEKIVFQLKLSEQQRLSNQSSTNRRAFCEGGHRAKSLSQTVDWGFR